MAFTVIGDTVNIANRLERLTRTLDCAMVVSDDVVRAVRERADEQGAAELLKGLTDKGLQQIRGRAGPVRIWTCDR